MKILIIDDEDTMLILLQEFLEAVGYQTETAKNGWEGLNKINSFQPDLILTDIIMPEKDGIEMLMEMKERKIKIPVVVMCGCAEGRNLTYLNLCKTLGAVKDFQKPFRLEDLGKFLENYFKNPADLQKTSLPPQET